MWYDEHKISENLVYCIYHHQKNAMVPDEFCIQNQNHSKNSYFEKINYENLFLMV